MVIVPCHSKHVLQTCPLNVRCHRDVPIFWLILLARRACSTAAMESPPPMMGNVPYHSMLMSSELKSDILKSCTEIISAPHPSARLTAVLERLYCARVTTDSLGGIKTSHPHQCQSFNRHRCTEKDAVTSDNRHDTKNLARGQEMKNGSKSALSMLLGLSVPAASF